MYYVNPIIKNLERVEQPENRGNYIRLDQNENPDGIPKWLYKKVIKKITPEYISIYPEEIKLTTKYAHLIGLEYENVTLTDGSVVGMGYIIKVFGEKGKKLICVTPSFGMYKVYAEMQEMETESIHYEDDYSFKIENILNRIDENTGIVSLVNPNMPIGNVYEQSDIEKVVEKAKSVNAIVIIDEAYYYFYEKGSVDLIKKYDNVIILRTFSKFLSIPGLRMGAVISSKENIKYINNYKPHYTVNTVAIAFGEAIIDNFDKVYSDLNTKFINGKKYLIQALDESNYSYIPTNGCFICIKPKYKTTEYITEELKKHNILILCGKGDCAGFIRVTIWDKKYMKIFMEALKVIDVES